jgi:hypothetical protein
MIWTYDVDIVCLSPVDIFICLRKYAYWTDLYVQRINTPYVWNIYRYDEYLNK